jgi:hypothetical protein
VAYTCNPSYLGGWDREVDSLSPIQAKSETPVTITTTKSIHGGTGLSSQLCGRRKVGGSWPRLPRQEKQDSTWKIAKANREGSLAQVVEHLPSKCEALSSNLCLFTFVVNQLSICVEYIFRPCIQWCIYFKFTSIPHCPYYYNFIITLEIR